MVWRNAIIIILARTIVGLASAANIHIDIKIAFHVDGEMWDVDARVFDFIETINDWIMIYWPMAHGTQPEVAKFIKTKCEIE